MPQSTSLGLTGSEGRGPLRLPRSGCPLRHISRERRGEDLDVVVTGHLEDRRRVLGVDLRGVGSCGLERELDAFVDLHVERHVRCTERIGARDLAPEDRARADVGRYARARRRPASEAASRIERCIRAPCLPTRARRGEPPRHRQGSDKRPDSGPVRETTPPLARQRRDGPLLRGPSAQAAPNPETLRRPRSLPPNRCSRER